jgi:hypothetical protein
MLEIQQKENDFEAMRFKIRVDTKVKVNELFEALSEDD